MSNDKNTVPGFGGKQYRVVGPKPAPQPEAKPNEGAPDTILTRQPLKSYPMSTGRGDLAPAFKQISVGLEGALTRERLEAAVLGGFLSASEAETIARAAGLKP